MNLQNISDRLNEWADEESRHNPKSKTDILDQIIDDLGDITKGQEYWTRDHRDAPQVHFRVNVSGLKRTPDATFTMDGDIRDVDMAEFWKQRDAFQREVDKRFPLETLAHFADLPAIEE